MLIIMGWAVLLTARHLVRIDLNCQSNIFNITSNNNSQMLLTIILPFTNLLGHFLLKFPLVGIA